MTGFDDVDTFSRQIIAKWGDFYYRVQMLSDDSLSFLVGRT